MDSFGHKKLSPHVQSTPCEETGALGQGLAIAVGDENWLVEQRGSQATALSMVASAGAGTGGTGRRSRRPLFQQCAGAG